MVVLANRSARYTLLSFFFTAPVFSFFGFSFFVGLWSPSLLFFFFFLAEIGKVGVGLGAGLDVGFGPEWMGSNLGIFYGWWGFDDDWDFTVSVVFSNWECGEKGVWALGLVSVKGDLENLVLGFIPKMVSWLGWLG